MPTNAAVTYQFADDNPPSNSAAPVSAPVSVPNSKGVIYSFSDEPKSVQQPTSSSSNIPSWASFLLGNQGTSTPGDYAALKAMITATPNMLANASSGIDTGVNALNNLVYKKIPSIFGSKGVNVPQLKSPSSFLPQSLQVTPEEKLLDPGSVFGGSVVGGLPLALATEGASLEASPDLAALKTFGKASHLKAIPYGIAQGALQGGIYSSPGNTLMGTLLGGATGGTLEGLAPIAKSVHANITTDPAVLNANLEAAQAEHATQLSNIATAKASLPAGAKGTPEAALVKISQTQNDIDNLQQQLNGTNPNPTLEQVFKGQNSAQRIAQSKNILNEANSDLTDSDQAQTDQLPTPTLNNTYNTEVGTTGAQLFNDEKNSLRGDYNSIKDRATQINVTPPDISDLTTMPQYASDLEDGVASNSEDKPDAMNALDAVNSAGSSNPQQINGSQLISLVKATRDAANKATARANAFGVGEDVRVPARAQANRLNAINTRLNKTMQDNFPSDLLADMQKTDTAYGQKVAPFYNNLHFSNMMENGTVPDNFLEAIAGNKPHQKVFQNLVKNNPELNRLALGQMYAKNPEALREYNPATEPFIQADPVTSGLRENQQLAASNVKNAQGLVDQVKAADPRQKLVDNLNNLNTYLTNLKSAHEARMIELQKGEMTAQKVAKMQKEIDDYNATRKTIKHHFKGHWGKMLTWGMLGYGIHYLGWHELFRMFEG